MCPNTDVEMTDSSDFTKKKPLLIYIISAIYLWSGLKGLFAGLWGPFMMWFISIEELKTELIKQPNYKEIIQSTKLLEEIPTDRYVFLTLGGITQIVAAYYLFKMKRKGLTFVILGLGISLISPIVHSLLYGWSSNFGKHGVIGFLFDWTVSFITVYYLWTLQKDDRLKAA